MAENLWTLIEPSFSKYKNLPAWICRHKDGNRIVSYQQIYQATLLLAHELRAMGIGQESTVGITAPNGPEWTVGALAAWKVGANIAPIHIGNSDHEIAMQIAAVSPKLMLTHEAKLEFENSMEISSISMNAKDDSVSKQAMADESQQPVSGNVDDVAVRIYTSGSTGTPKVVRLSHGNHVSNVLAACNVVKFNSKDRFLSLLPFSHAMGLTANLLAPLYSGSVIVLPKVLAATEIIEAMAEEKISVVIAVPRLFRNIMLGLEKKFGEAGKGLQVYLCLLRAAPMFLKQYLNAPIRKKFGGAITVWVSGGSHLDGKISKYYHALGLPLRQGYGLTETAPLTSVQENFDPAVESVGKPVEQVEVKIHNPDDAGNGEVWIKGPNVMLGYEDEKQNSEVFEGDWFKTGDIARIDAQGRITLTGRSKRLIVTEAGKNVYPEELETLLERNNLVKEAGVFELGMKPVAVLAMESQNPEADARSVLKSFNDLVSSHNQIYRFAVTDELPRTPLGKTALQRLPDVFDQLEVK